MLAQLEKEAKPKKAAPKAKAPATKGATAVEAEEEEEEEEDPVERELTRYGIITENPWEKGVKCASACLLPCCSQHG